MRKGIIWTNPCSGGRVNYWSLAGNWDLYMYDLSTHSRSSQMFPVIYGDRIVWMDSRNGEKGNYWNLTGNWEIYMYALSTSKETQITTNSSNLQRPACPAIYGNMVVWEDDRNGNKDIYMYTVSEENTGQDAEQQSERGKNKSIPGFEIVYSIASLFEVFLHKRS